MLVSRAALELTATHPVHQFFQDVLNSVGICNLALFIFLFIRLFTYLSLPLSCEFQYRWGCDIFASPRTSTASGTQKALNAYAELTTGPGSPCCKQRKTEGRRFNWKVKEPITHQRITDVGPTHVKQPYLPQRFTVSRQCGRLPWRARGLQPSRSHLCLQISVGTSRDSTWPRPSSRPSSGHASARD